MSLVPGSLPSGTCYGTPQELLDLFAQYLDVPAFLADSKILQVVEGTTTISTAVTSNTLANTGLSVTITPTSTANRILIFVNQSVSAAHNGTSTGAKMSVVQTVNSSPTPVSTSLYVGVKDLGLSGASGNLLLTAPWSFSYLTSAIATLDSVTYKTQGCTIGGATQTVTFQPDSQRSSILAIEVKG